MVEAEASVLPTRSSTTWTLMCLEERVTTKRGRSFVPLIFLRPRTWRRRRDATRADDRKRVVEGKGVSGRVDVGGGRSIKKKKSRESEKLDKTYGITRHNLKNKH